MLQKLQFLPEVPLPALAGKGTDLSGSMTMDPKMLKETVSFQLERKAGGQVLTVIFPQPAANKEGSPLFAGSMVEKVRKGFEAIVADAGLPAEITPHWLRHTCCTWLMEADVPAWEAAAFAGMTVKALEDNYGHHRPTHQARARKALG